MIDSRIARERVLEFLKGNPIPALAGMEEAVVSHWIQNPDDSVYAGFRDIFAGAVVSARKRRSDHFVAEAERLECKFRMNVPFPPPPKPRFTFIDLFAGIGGFRIAMQNQSGQCVFSSEWDKAAQKTYEANFGEVPFGDITRQEIKDMIPDGFDVLCAGFPCQPFSLAGVSARKSLKKEHGFACKTQGTLFFDVMQIAKVKRPKVLFLENVRNLVNHDKGRTFAVIEESVRELGYSFHSAVIDASPFVPQKRIRCYIVCVRENGGFEFPKISGSPKPLSSVLESDVDSRYTISDKLWQGHQKRTQRNLSRGTGFTTFCADVAQPAHTLVSRYYKDGKECLIPQTLGNPRMLTPRECARLQGYDDKFLLPQSRCTAYRQMGNSVAVPVVEKIAAAIYSQILKGESHEIRDSTERKVCCS